MATLAEAARTFLAQPRIAVVGVSRQTHQPANCNFRKLRTAGHAVFPVNPQADTVEGETCYPTLAAIPGGVQAVLIFTPPAASEAVVREAAALGIRHVWLHRALGGGSHSPAAERAARELGLTLIPGGCPAMFGPPVDFGHQCLRWVLGTLGQLPTQIGAGPAATP